jgi:hypothetical protein
MAQLNVSFDDALLAEVDRLAAERGINRPELLRALVREAIGAEGKVGGAVVMPPPTAPEPLLVTTPQFLSSLERMALDLDRVLRDMDRREVRLGKALAARAALDAGAEAQLAGVIGERVDASLGGFEHRLTKQLACPAKWRCRTSSPGWNRTSRPSPNCRLPAAGRSQQPCDAVCGDPGRCAAGADALLGLAAPLPLASRGAHQA